MNPIYTTSQPRSSKFIYSNMDNGRTSLNQPNFNDILSKSSGRDSLQLSSGNLTDSREPYIYAKSPYDTKDIFTIQASEISRFNPSGQTVETSNYILKENTNDKRLEIGDRETGYEYARFDLKEEYSSLHFVRDEKSGKLLMVQDINVPEMAIDHAIVVNGELESALCKYLNVEELPIEDMNEVMPGLSDKIGEYSGITFFRLCNGIYGKILISNMKEKQVFDELVETYERDYPNITYSIRSHAYSYACREIFGNCKRVDGGIFSYAGSTLSYRDEKDSSKSWVIDFEIDIKEIDVKDLFESNGFNLETMLNKNFKYWIELFKDEKLANIASKMRFAEYGMSGEESQTIHGLW